VAMKSTDIQLFGVATVMLVSLGHACANQAYPAAVDLLKGREIGPVTGIVALGGGMFGFLGPQLLGSLREASGSFTLGWTVMTVTTTAILVVILLMGRYSARAARV
jgi:nitrate/nitrite transporter NarK